MSWSINLIGEKKAVATKVLAEQHVPKEIQGIVASIALDDKSPNGLKVVSHGHIGGHATCKCEIESVYLELPPQTV